MITCFLKYTLDPAKIDQFENYARAWIPLVNKFGGNHLGYFLPHEGANNTAYALFNFPSLAAYEQYRQDSMNDPDCLAAYRMAEDSNCIISYERSFLKPLNSFQPD
ncbi:MAG: NIPSNAP family protein [Bacteroidota bacterium]